MTDKVEEMKKVAHEEECANESEPKCEYCKDTGVIQKTEWSGTDDSYEVEKKCVCQED